MNMKTIEQYKEELFSSLFENNVVRHSHSKEGSYVSVSMHCKNEVLNAHMNKLFVKYRGSGIPRQDFFNEYVMWAWKSLQRFEIPAEENATWEQVLNGEAPAIIGKIIKNIKTTTGHELYRFSNPDAKFTRGELNGVKGQHITLKLKVESLDALLFVGEGEEKTLEDFVHSEDNLFNNINDKYYITYFSKWFNDNKHEILTNSQNKLLKDLALCKKVPGYTENDVYEYTGVPSYKINTRLNRISTRVLKAWDKGNHVHIKNRLEMERDSKLEMLAEFIAIAEDESNLDTQNIRLSNWIKKYHNNTLVMDLLDKVNRGQMDRIVATNRYIAGSLGQVPSIVLYDFLIAVEDEIERLNKMDCRVKPVNIEANKKVAEEDRTSLVKVQDKTGQFIRYEIDIEQEEGKANIIYILPGGVEVATRGKLANKKKRG